MDPRFLEYVLVHEMTHLWARGHGERFQRLMDGWLPDWRDMRREMNRQIVWSRDSR
jgi:predicted metal-dependent hydrolase